MVVNVLYMSILLSFSSLHVWYNDIYILSASCTSCIFLLSRKSGCYKTKKNSGTEVSEFLYCEEDYFNFAATFSNISLVIDSKSHSGFQPHSSRAQVSSKEFGQLREI